MSYALKSMGYAVTSNDFLAFPAVIAAATVANDVVTLTSEDVEQITGPTADGRDFIQTTFDGLYFTADDRAFLDSAWSHIDPLEGAKRDLAIAALVLAAARKPRGVFTFTDLRYDDGRRDLRLPLRDHFVETAAEYNSVVFDSGRRCQAAQSDIFDVDPAGYDLVYLDPPYAPPKDDNCYIKRYHFLEGLSVYWRGQEVMEHTRTKKLVKRFTPFSYKRTIVDVGNGSGTGLVRFWFGSGTGRGGTGAEARYPLETDQTAVAWISKGPSPVTRTALSPHAVPAQSSPPLLHPSLTEVPLPRRMSVSLTIDQVRNRTKTVTRRRVDTWRDLKAGDRLVLIEKGMGLAKGAKQVVVAEVEVIDASASTTSRRMISCVWPVRCGHAPRISSHVSATMYEDRPSAYLAADTSVISETVTLWLIAAPRDTLTRRSGGPLPGRSRGFDHGDVVDPRGQDGPGGGPHFASAVGGASVAGTADGEQGGGEGPVVDADQDRSPAGRVARGAVTSGPPGMRCSTSRGSRRWCRGRCAGRSRSAGRRRRTTTRGRSRRMRGGLVCLR